eukprot:TRINITY_DN3389_c0_g1_i2.p1 TRINITY_DN3389_c0_g1~~TRINITY_DN3389_c0_g1_i2.p1  ORF type:complete len:1250 (-),score=235.11 TRINITY_DN3389_c0_g1_i2:11-3760(-)
MSSGGSRKKARVVVVGGGFAGVSTVVKLERDKRLCRHADICFVDSKDFFENTSAIFKTFGDPLATPPNAVQVLHSSYLQHADFVQGEVVTVSRTHLIVRVEASVTIMLPYDYLVLCTGCSYPLAKEQNITQPFRADWLLREAQNIKEASTIAVIGGGPTGVELTANIISKYPSKALLLVHQHPHLVERFPEKAQQFIEQYLTDRGVRLLLGERISDMTFVPKETAACTCGSAYSGTASGGSDKGSSIESTTSEEDTPVQREDRRPAACTCCGQSKGEYQLVTDKGTQLTTDLVFVCAGPLCNTEYMQRHFSSCVASRGRLKVTNTLNLVGFPNIFVAGDITDVPEEKTAERAIAHSDVIAKNVSSLVVGKSASAFYCPLKREPLYILSLGYDYAIAIEAGSIVLTGERPAKMKRNMDLCAKKLFPSASLFSWKQPTLKSPPLQLELLQLPPPQLTVSQSCPTSPRGSESSNSASSSSQHSTSSITGRHSPPVSPGMYTQQSPRQLPPRDRRHTPSPSPTGCGSEKVAVFLAGKNCVGYRTAKILQKAMVPVRIVVQADQYDEITSKLSTWRSRVVEVVPNTLCNIESCVAALNGVGRVLLPLTACGAAPQQQLACYAAAVRRLQPSPHTLVCYQYCTFTHELCQQYPICEEQLEALSIPYSVVHYDREFYNIFLKMSKPSIMLQRTLMLPLTEEQNVYLVAPNEVATGFANLLSFPSWPPKRVYEFHGPRSLSGEDMAKALSSALLDEVKFMPLPQLIARARLSSITSEDQMDCHLYMGRTQALKPVHRSKSDLILGLSLNDDPISDLDIVLGRPAVPFNDWVKKKFVASAQGYENLSLDMLAARGGIRKLVVEVMAGNREVHHEIPAEDVTLDEEIGRGAAGRVFKGTYLGTPVAVKQLNCDFIAFSSLEFRVEIGVLSLLRHPNLIPFFGATTKTAEQLFLVFELMERGSLDKLLAESEAPLPYAVQLRFAINLAKGLHYLHVAGVMHLDFKCSNILVSDSLQLKITDLGTARPSGFQDGEAIAGTPQYTAPEILLKKSYSFSADCYSYGIVLWQIVTRKEPYAQFKVFDIFEFVTHGGRPTPIPEFSPFIKLIATCWNQKPEKRPDTAAIIKELDTHTLPQTVPRVSSRRFASLVQLIKGKNPNVVSGHDTTNLSTTALYHIGAEVRHPTRGIPVQDNVVTTVLYPSTFSGTAVVDWIIAHKNLQRQLAVQAAQWLLVTGHIVQATSKNAAELAFVDGPDTLYKFP